MVTQLVVTQLLVGTQQPNARPNDTLLHMRQQIGGVMGMAPMGITLRTPVTHTAGDGMQGGTAASIGAAVGWHWGGIGCGRAEPASMPLLRPKLAPLTC